MGAIYSRCVDPDSNIATTAWLVPSRNGNVASVCYADGAGQMVMGYGKTIAEAVCAANAKWQAMWKKVSDDAKTTVV